jgi:hypothetical protein
MTEHEWLVKLCEKKQKAIKEFVEVINGNSLEGIGGDTPDYVLAEYLYSCLENFGKCTLLRDQHYGKKMAESYVNYLHKQDRHK